MNDFVSILLPVFNGDKFLELSIKSVISQTYSNFELLIFNDGSNDNTANIINSFADKRIKIFNSNKNKGIVNALNSLIRQSKGKYIARIDADDIWYKNKLLEQINFIKKHPKYKMIACFARLVDDEGKDFPTNFKQYSAINDIKKYLPNSNFIIHSSVLINKDVFNEIGVYREKYLHTEDYDLWLRMLSNNIDFIIMPKILLDYRVSVYSVNFRFRKLQSKNVIKLKFNYWKKNGFKLFYLIELRKNFYYWFFPYWILKLKLKLINRHYSH